MVTVSKNVILGFLGDQFTCEPSPADICNLPARHSSPLFQSKIQNLKSKIARRSLGEGGFTLIELLAIMAIMVILFGIATAASVHWGRAARMRSSVQKIHASLSQARQWAVTHHFPTAFVPGNDLSVRRGYFAITNDSQGIIGITNYLANGTVWTNDLEPLIFLPDGSLDSHSDRDLIVTEYNKGDAGLVHTITVYRVTGHAQTSD